MPDIIHMVGPDIAKPSKSGLYGHIDAITAAGISGWLVDLQGTAGDLAALVHKQVVARGKLDIWRQDLCDIFGLPHTFGFRLAWLPGSLGNIKLFRNVNYPLIFTFNGRDFVFANFPQISGAILWEIKSALPQGFHRRAEVAEKLEDAAKDSIPDCGIKLLAMYEPGFYTRHPSEQNGDLPVWAKIARAKPSFPGHFPPSMPGELGIYDPRLAETREKQAELAREHGIYGFCWRYYWRGGRPNWQKPLWEMLQSGEPDFPFCLCCRVDISGAGSRSAGDAANFMQSVIPALLDPRYIHEDGAPLVLIESRALSSMTGIGGILRQVCANYGIEHVHLCAVNMAKLPEGFDSIARIPPFPAAFAQSGARNAPSGFLGKIFSFEELVEEECNRPVADFREFTGLMTAWDNSPLAGKQALVYSGATVSLYEAWLNSAIARAKESGNKFVFINAWNDWAHGARLEPDATAGRATLSATARAIAGRSGWRELIESARASSSLSGTAGADFLARIEASLLELELRANWYEKMLQGKQPSAIVPLRQGMPPALEKLQLIPGGQICIDYICDQKDPVMASIGRDEDLYCEGWSLVQGVPQWGNTPVYFLLLSEEGDILYYGFIGGRRERPDVAKAFANMDVEYSWNSGFAQKFSLGNVNAGVYRLGTLTLAPAGAYVAASNVRLEVEP